MPITPVRGRRGPARAGRGRRPTGRRIRGTAFEHLADEPALPAPIGPWPRGESECAAGRRRARGIALPGGDRPCSPGRDHGPTLRALSLPLWRMASFVSDAVLDAREHLRTAHDMLAEMGAAVFTQRAARELLATGETARHRMPDTRSQLTAQENPDRLAGARRALEPRDRLPALHQPAHSRIPPPQGLHEAGDHLPHPARSRPQGRDSANRSRHAPGDLSLSRR